MWITGGAATAGIALNVPLVASLGILGVAAASVLAYEAMLIAIVGCARTMGTRLLSLPRFHIPALLFGGYLAAIHAIDEAAMGPVPSAVCKVTTWLSFAIICALRSGKVRQTACTLRRKLRNFLANDAPTLHT